MPTKAFLKKKSLLDKFKDNHQGTGFIQSARAEHTWNNPLTRYKRTKKLNGWIKSFAGKKHVHKLARFNAMQNENLEEAMSLKGFMEALMEKLTKQFDLDEDKVQNYLNSHTQDLQELLDDKELSLKEKVLFVRSEITGEKDEAKAIPEKTLQTVMANLVCLGKPGKAMQNYTASRRREIFDELEKRGWLEPNSIVPSSKGKELAKDWVGLCQEDKKSERLFNKRKMEHIALSEGSKVSPYLVEIAHKILTDEYGWKASTIEEVADWLGDHKQAFEHAYGQALRSSDDDKANVKAGIEAALDEEERGVMNAEIAMMGESKKQTNEMIGNKKWVIRIKRLGKNYYVCSSSFRVNKAFRYPSLGGPFVCSDWDITERDIAKYDNYNDAKKAWDGMAQVIRGGLPFYKEGEDYEIVQVNFSMMGESKEPADEKLGYEKGHKNSRGENAPWVIRSHEDNRVLASFAKKEDAEAHLQRMKQYSKEESKENEAMKENKNEDSLPFAYNARFGDATMMEINKMISMFPNIVVFESYKDTDKPSYRISYNPDFGKSTRHVMLIIDDCDTPNPKLVPVRYNNDAMLNSRMGKTFTLDGWNDTGAIKDCIDYIVSYITKGMTEAKQNEAEEPAEIKDFRSKMDDAVGKPFDNLHVSADGWHKKERDVYYDAAADEYGFCSYYYKEVDGTTYYLSVDYLMSDDLVKSYKIWSIPSKKAEAYTGDINDFIEDIIDRFYMEYDYSTKNVRQFCKYFKKEIGNILNSDGSDKFEQVRKLYVDWAGISEAKEVTEDEGKAALRKLSKRGELPYGNNMRTDGLSLSRIADEIRYDVATALDMAAEACEDAMLDYGYDRIYVAIADGKTPEEVAADIKGSKQTESTDDDLRSRMERVGNELLESGDLHAWEYDFIKECLAFCDFKKLEQYLIRKGWYTSPTEAKQTEGVHLDLEDTLQVPAWLWKAYLFNDTTDLEEDEIEKFHDFKEQYKDCHLDDEDGEPYFSSYNDFDSLGGNVYDVKVYRMSSDT